MTDAQRDALDKLREQYSYVEYGAVGPNLYVDCYTGTLDLTFVKDVEIDPSGHVSVKS